MNKRTIIVTALLGGSMCATHGFAYDECMDTEHFSQLGGSIFTPQTSMSMRSTIRRLSDFVGYKNLRDIDPIQILPGQKVLDIGAGDGKFTKYLESKAGYANVYALEPDKESFSELKEKMGSDFSRNWTLQEALNEEPQIYFQKFDVVTVLKYNVPCYEKINFIKALSKTVNKNGTIYITSVERDKVQCRFDTPYIMDILNEEFKHVDVREISDGKYVKYALITCKTPYLE